MRLSFIYLIMAITFISSCQVNTKRFTSNDGWYSLALPVGWSEYDDGDDGTYAFYNATTWTGNLRITTLHWENKANEDATSEFISQEMQENKGASKIRVGAFDGTFYKTEVEEDGVMMPIYYWIFGKNNNMFICSFTTNKKHEQDKNTLAEVEGIIQSITIN